MIPTFLLGRNDMKQKCSIEQIKKNLLPILDSQQIELVDIELIGKEGNQVLRIYIDQRNGITLDQCKTVSREMSDILDMLDLIQGRYRLEVSSPGIDRPLKNEKDFKRNINRKVKIEYFTNENEKELIIGIIQAVDINSVTVHDDQKNISILLENIKSAKILPVW